MQCRLTVVRYPSGMGWAGLVSMALFRLPLLFSRSHSFWKLMGSGKNGTFDKTPDWLQWAVLEIGDEAFLPDTPRFLINWWKWMGCEKWLLIMEALEGHGTWDGKACFGTVPKQSSYEGPIAVLTRASIRFSKLSAFWKNVDAVARQMAGADGFLFSLGIGEVPWIKQATFSIWESKEKMKLFAYQLQEHAAVIRKTRKENWYSEEMFVRFRMISSTGSIRGKNPLDGKL